VEHHVSQGDVVDLDVVVEDIRLILSLDGIHGLDAASQALRRFIGFDLKFVGLPFLARLFSRLAF